MGSNKQFVYLKGPVPRLSPTFVFERAVTLLLFFKPNYFKNHSKPMFLLLRATGIVTVMAALVVSLWLGLRTHHPFDFARFFTPGAFEGEGRFLFGLVLGFLTSVGYVYMNLATDLNKRWAYAASLHQEILLKCHGEPPTPARTVLKEYLELSLALDLITSELWAHRSFGVFFQKCLTDAIRHIPAEVERSALLAKLQDGEITEARARRLLERYRRSLRETLESLERPNSRVLASKAFRKVA